MQMSYVRTCPLQRKVVQERLFYPPSVIQLKDSSVKLQLMFIQQLSEGFEAKLDLCTDT